ncbi:MAG: uroporphyrinogen-III synthase [Actinomycetota bacterium]
MRILVTRPLPDAQHEVEALAAHGHEGVLAPLLVIEEVKDVTLDLNGAQALIVTSRNALRALAHHPALAAARNLSLFAVGGATAEAARDLGFATVIDGPGTGAGLAELIIETTDPKDGRLVHLAGATLAFDLRRVLQAEGFSVTQPVLYRALPAGELPGQALRSLKDGTLDGVILMSPRTAKTFLALLERYGALTQGMRLVCYCISQAVAEVLAPLGFSVRVATGKREEDVLALLDSEAASS